MNGYGSMLLAATAVRGEGVAPEIKVYDRRVSTMWKIYTGT